MPPYVVQPGNTLGEIAQRFGSSVDALMRANGIDDPDLILVGQILCVPPRGQQQILPTEPYIVQPGDTLGGIAEDFGLTVDDLVRFNRIRNPDLIFVGQIVCAPNRSGVTSGENGPNQGRPTAPRRAVGRGHPRSGSPLYP